jgi:hypothetical protein
MKKEKKTKRIESVPYRRGATREHPRTRPALLVQIGGPQPPISKMLTFEVDLI